ncbi:hypothetical protein [Desulfotignum balticum]|jgi:hypothetical protein|uniref:hypothetical protein n=1 Tax=Desulfotignum balticum TaxID=115781 RepID=UPI0003F68D08|nr:hypothetical protein [Desulfotignum balticum]
MSLKNMMKKKVKFKKIASPSTEEYKKRQDEINSRIKDIVKQYDRSIEEASKHYVR